MKPTFDKFLVFGVIIGGSLGPPSPSCGTLCIIEGFLGHKLDLFDIVVIFVIIYLISCLVIYKLWWEGRIIKVEKINNK